MDESGPKGPPAASVTEKLAGGVLVKRQKRARKTQEEKRIQALQVVDWATDISGKHPNLVNEFLTSRDERVRYEAWKTITAYRWGLPTGRVEVDLRAAARMLAASRGISEHALLERAAKIVDGVTTVSTEVAEPAKPEPVQAVVVEEPDPE